MSASTTPSERSLSANISPLAWISVYLELGKARLNSFVVLTAVVGYAVAARGAWELDILFWTALGTALSACGANGLNQLLEAPRDALMDRTRGRPLPSGRIGTRHALVVSLAGVLVGSALLAVAVNPLTALLASFVALLYVLVYTPLKTRTIFNTAVGAVCGGIPPMMGWAAATGSLDAGAWVLGAILFNWQIPHFLALAWMYREDYARGGYRMLPQADESGRWTCLATVFHSLLLIPIAWLGGLLAMAGWLYGAGALLLGGLMVVQSARFLHAGTRGAARSVFLTSLIYLPVLLALLVIDAPAGSAREPEASPRRVLTSTAAPSDSSGVGL
jgi:protoheme IX farnesyltransferase